MVCYRQSFALMLLVVVGVTVEGTFSAHRLQQLQQLQQYRPLGQPNLLPFPYKTAQRYVIIGNRPYAIVGDDIKYVPAVQQQELTPVPAPAPATHVSHAAPATHVSHAAPATHVSHAAPATHVSHAAPATHVTIPASTVTATISPAIPETASASTASDAAASATSAGAAAAATTTTTTTQIHPPLAPSPGGSMVMTVSNPKVTVHRTEHVYTLTHPPKTIKYPVTVDFTRLGLGDAKVPFTVTETRHPTIPFTVTFDGQPQSVPSASSTPSVSVSPSSTLSSTPSRVQWAYSQPAAQTTITTSSVSSPPVVTTFPVASSVAQDFAHTLAQRPLFTLDYDPSTRTTFLVDGVGRRIPLHTQEETPGIPIQSPLPTTTTTTTATAGTPGSTTTVYYGAAANIPPANSASPAPAVGSTASENFKSQQMTALTPLGSGSAPISAPASGTSSDTAAGGVRDSWAEALERAEHAASLSQQQQQQQQ